MDGSFEFGFDVEPHQPNPTTLFTDDTDVPVLISAGEAPPAELAGRALPAAPQALSGIEFHYLVGAVPATSQVPLESRIQRGAFVLYPNVVYDEDRNPLVAYYVAFFKEANVPAYYVGPDAVGAFLNRIDEWTRWARIAYAFGYPNERQVEAIKVGIASMQGEFGTAARMVLESNRDAFKDRLPARRSSRAVELGAAGRWIRAAAPAPGTAFQALRRLRTE